MCGILIKQSFESQSLSEISEIVQVYKNVLKLEINNFSFLPIHINLITLVTYLYMTLSKTFLDNIHLHILLIKT